MLSLCSMCLVYIMVYCNISPQQTDLSKKEKALTFGRKKIEGDKTMFIVLYQTIYEIQLIVNNPQIFPIFCY